MPTNPFENRPITRDPVHLIYRLHDSLPRKVITDLAANMENELAALRIHFQRDKVQDLTQNSDFRVAAAQIKATFQLRYDQALDKVTSGPHFLADPAAKKIIIDSWLYLETTEPLEIYAISVMSNHVHVLLAHKEEEGVLDIDSLLFNHKKFTARQINARQLEPGRKVWARKAFDRDVRRNAFGTVLWYILNNPVKAGLSLTTEWVGNYLSPVFR